MGQAFERRIIENSTNVYLELSNSKENEQRDWRKFIRNEESTMGDKQRKLRINIVSIINNSSVSFIKINLTLLQSSAAVHALYNNWQINADPRIFARSDCLRILKNLWHRIVAAFTFPVTARAKGKHWYRGWKKREKKYSGYIRLSWVFLFRCSFTFVKYFSVLRRAWLKGPRSRGWSKGWSRGWIIAE